MIHLLFVLIKLVQTNHTQQYPVGCKARVGSQETHTHNRKRTYHEKHLYALYLSYVVDLTSVPMFRLV